MSVDTAIIVAGFILVITAIGMIVFVASRKQQAKEDELKRAASTRGWKFDVTSERGYRVRRWTGSTDGVSWTAESRTHSGGNQKGQQRRPHISRWHADFSPGVNAPIVCMGVAKGKEIPSFDVAQGDGFLAKLAQKAVGFAFDKAIDVYFGEALGKEVDAGAMVRVESKLPGFVVMAANKDEGARILSQGLERTLTDATIDKSSFLSDEDRPWVLLRPHGISLARTAPLRDANDVDRLIRAGMALTHSSKFARPFA